MEGEQHVSFAQELGLDKPDGWMEEQNKRTSSFMREKVETLDVIISQYLMDTNQAVFLLTIKVAGQQHTLTDLLSLFFFLGYMRGRVDQEAEQELEKLGQLWKEE